MRPSRPTRASSVLVVTLVSALGLFWLADTVADPDLWGHVRFGRDILQARAVPRTDAYSYRTAGQVWINHEWLSEVVFASIYDAGGPAGLIGLKTLLGVSLLGVGVLHLRMRGVGAFAALVLAGLLCVPLRMGLGTVRPQLFTYLGFFLLLVLIERARPGRERWLWGAPWLLAVWVNLHGGVLAGAGILGLWGLARVVRYRWEAGRSRLERVRGVAQVAAILVVSGLALLLNPYGAELPRFLWRTATVPRPEILEWAPLAVVSLPGLVYVVLVAATVLGFAFSRRQVEAETVLIVGVSALLPVVSGRHFPLSALAVLVLGGEHIGDAWARWRGHGETHRPRGVLTRLAVLGVSLLLAVLAVPRFGCIRLDPRHFPFPARAVALLRASGVSGNLALPFDWGEYALWSLGPRVRVSIDGRRETVYSDASYRQSRDFEQGTGDWEALLRDAPTDMVLAPNGTPMANLMDRTAGWRLIYRDTQSRLYMREGSPLQGKIAGTSVPALPDDGNGLCFPSPGRGGLREGYSGGRRAH